MPRPSESGCRIFDGPQLKGKCLKDVVFGRLALLHIYELILGWVLGATRTSQRSWKGLFYHFPLSQLPQIRGKHKLGLGLGVLERSRWWAPRATSAQVPLVQVHLPRCGTYTRIPFLQVMTLANNKYSGKGWNSMGPPLITAYLRWIAVCVQF